MLKGGVSWSQIQAATGCSRATIAKIAKRAGWDIRTAGFSKAPVRRPRPLVCTEAGSGG